MADLRIGAAAREMSVAAVVIEAIEHYADAADETEALTAERDLAQSALAVKDETIRTLTALGEPLVARVRGLQEEIAAKDAKIDALEKAIVMGSGRSSGPLPKPIAPADPTSEKAVAKVLPVAGTQFDRQPTWWEKKQQQAPTKGKDKR